MTEVGIDVSLHGDEDCRTRRPARSRGSTVRHRADHVAPRSEGAGLFVHPILAGEFFREVRRYEFTKLMQCAAVVRGRRYVFHLSDSLVGTERSDTIIRRRPPFLSALRQRPQLNPMR